MAPVAARERTVQRRWSSGTLCSTTTTDAASTFAAARTRRVFCCCSFDAGSVFVGRGSLRDFSLREPSSAFFSCSMSRWSFAISFACATT